ncbi:hypothetical protein MKW92_037294 [Papaver armeniacum]|nr:hypothetical protein MKW92_037294 [Papaver armeniacum]
MLKERLAAAEKDVLVSMVKIAQQRRLEGSKGVWQVFLNEHDRKFGASLSDPSKRSVDVLVSFLETFTDKEAEAKFLEKVLEWHSNRKAVFELIKNSTTDREKLVQLTYEHPDYSYCYSFKSYDEDWVVTSMGDMSKSSKILAVDCEMVECEDGTEPVVKVCVVDEKLKVKLNKLVNPNKPVKDYRTEITGITAQDLEGVTCSLADVQKSLEKLLSDGAILIGHSLDCDLKALKLDHGRVIDTSLVFRRADGKRTSLSDLCKVVLKRDVREEGAQHNCLDDAGAPMKLVKHVLEKGYDEAMKVFSDYLSKQIFLYRIPVSLSEEELRAIVPMDSAVVLKLRYQQRAKTYSATAFFKDQDEANYTFQGIECEEVKDTNGLQHKLIPVQPNNEKCASGCIHVRKMVRDDDSPVPDSSLRKRQIKEAVEPSNKEPQKNSDCLKRGKIIQLLQEQLQYCKNNSKY